MINKLAKDNPSSTETLFPEIYSFIYELAKEKDGDKKRNKVNSELMFEKPYHYCYFSYLQNSTIKLTATT